jgi:hypothetical protein
MLSWMGCVNGMELLRCCCMLPSCCSSEAVLLYECCAGVLLLKSWRPPALPDAAGAECLLAGMLLRRLPDASMGCCDDDACLPWALLAAGAGAADMRTSKAVPERILLPVGPLELVGSSSNSARLMG